MNAASLKKSRRLQRLHALLLDGREHSTLEIVAGAQICAVNAAISELRQNGADISCRMERREDGPVWFYRMISPVPADAPDGQAA